MADVLLMPTALAEVDRIAPGTTLLAGGTDLLVQRRDGLRTGSMADISRLRDAPAPVRYDGGTIRLSALAPLAVLDRDLAGAGLLPGLRAAIASFASAQIRNRATLGGNLANASPAGDTIPPLVAAGAIAVLRGPDGVRTVPVAGLITGPRRTGLTPGEWIVSVEIPRGTVPQGQAQAGFRKLAGRRALAISIASLAWMWSLRPDGTLSGVRLAAGAVAPVVVRCTGAESVLEGRAPDPDTVRAAVRALDGDIRPIDDLRATAGYRRTALAGVLTEVLLAAGSGAAAPGDAGSGAVSSGGAASGAAPAGSANTPGGDAIRWDDTRRNT